MARRYTSIRHGHRTPVTPRIIQGTWTGRRFPGDPVFAANCARLAKAFAGARYRVRKTPIAELLASVEQTTHILHGLAPAKHRIVPLLLDIARFSGQWVRRPGDFAPAATSPRAQVTELIAHLFERYPTPRFLRPRWHPWRDRDWLAFGWYVHVAGGQNIRTAPGLPTSLTRKAAHALAGAPKMLSPRQGIRWAQLHALGASPTLIDAILRRREALDFERDDLWLPLFAKLAAVAGFPPHQVGPIIDYVRYRRFDHVRGEVFSLKGRSVESLLAGMHGWHAALNHHRRVYAVTGLGPRAAQQVTWSPLRNVTALEEERGVENWKIDEIVTFPELFDEGQRMRHCVATYARHCMSGSMSIWSLRVMEAGVEVGRVTIRVDVNARKVVEARSFANRAVPRAHYSFLETWARRNRLRVGSIPVA